jgi:hypothetical protein
MGEAFDQDFREWDKLKGIHQLNSGGQTNIEYVLRCHLAARQIYILA